jgi:hypothetical protein
MAGDRKHCSGCRDDFYNGQNELGVKECWSLKSAKVVTRYRLGWWTTPDTPGAFTKVKTNSCHHAPGRYAMYEKLPSFVSITEVLGRR